MIARSIFKVGDSVVVTRNVTTNKGRIDTGSTGSVVEIKDSSAPRTVIQMTNVLGSNLVGERVCLYEDSLSLISTLAAPNETLPDEKELRRRRDIAMARALGFD